MSPPPQDELYRWLVAMVVRLPRVTLTGRPPAPDHLVWLPLSPLRAGAARNHVYIENQDRPDEPGLLFTVTRTKIIPPDAEVIDLPAHKRYGFVVEPESQKKEILYE